MAPNVINRINNKLTFLHRINYFLTLALRRLLCNALMHIYFDYVWYTSLIKKWKHRIWTTQSKCMRFCLQLDKLKIISHKEFERLNWLPVTYRFKQCVNSIIFKYFGEQCPNYINKVFDVVAESNYQLRGSFQKLKCPFRETNTGQIALSYISPTFWNTTKDTLKRANNLNTFIHNLKRFFLSEHKNFNNSS